tara:strand:- start:316 stop:456 length:141 start_codon:yes stop_codon:yes gene_type:complete
LSEAKYLGLLIEPSIPYFKEHLIISSESDDTTSLSINFEFFAAAIE